MVSQNFFLRHRRICEAVFITAFLSITTARAGAFEAVPCAGLSAVPVMPAAKACFSGQISGRPSETDLSGAKVQLIDQQSGKIVDETSTSSDGSYSFNGVADGLYFVRISKKGYQEAESDIYRMSDGKDLNIGKLQLYPLSALVTGKILGNDPEHSAGLPGVEVDLVDEGGRTTASAHTGPDGKFAFQDVPYGKYHLNANKEGYASTTSEGTFIDDDTDLCGEGLVMLRYCDYRIRVLDYATHAPLAAKLQLMRGDTQVLPQVEADPSGCYTFSHLTGGYYLLNINMEGYNANRVTPFFGSEDLSETYYLSERPSIGGVVSDSKARPVGGAKVRLLRNGRELVTEQTTQADGNYQFVTPFAGEYTVEAGKTGFMDDESGVINFSGGLSFIEDLTLEYFHILGKIIDADTHAPLEADLQLQAESGSYLGKSKADKGGYYSVETQGPGLYSLTVSMPGYQSQVADIRFSNNAVGNATRLFALDKAGAINPAPKPEPADVHKIHIPKMAGLSTVPVAGIYSVAESDSFHISVLPNAGYSLENLVVTCNDIPMPGAFDIWGQWHGYIKQPMYDMLLAFSGVSQSGGNNTSTGPSARPESGRHLLAIGGKGLLSVYGLEHEFPLYIYNVYGHLVYKAYTHGLSNTCNLHLPQGLYLVANGNEVEKVFVR
ncbi:MAG: carboxypeptidase regulatory-like domain-containing protein [Tannerella sp.]|jgi:hypothetical protein|nr:carboxypeptidase regulatory-like domain-containing protein [Tannerella sp.]